MSSCLLFGVIQGVFHKATFAESNDEEESGFPVRPLATSCSRESLGQALELRMTVALLCACLYRGRNIVGGMAFT